MAELKSINCPNCGGNFALDTDRKTLSCPYCGCGLIYDDGTKVIIKRYYDEAKIGQIEADEKAEERRLEERKRRLVMMAGWGGVSILLIIVTALIGAKNIKVASFLGLAACFMISIPSAVLVTRIIFARNETYA